MAEPRSPGPVRRHERVVLFAVDLSLAALSFAGALLLVYGPNAIWRMGTLVLVCAPTLMAICAGVFAGFGLYSRRWRSASAGDAAAIVGAVLVSVLLFALVSRIDGRLAFLPPGAFAATAILLVGAVGASRLMLRVSGLRRALAALGGREADPAVPILLVGGGNEGALFLRALAADEAPPYRPAGVLDDDEPAGSMLRGVPVLGGLLAFDEAVDALRAGGAAPRHAVFVRPLATFGMERAEALLDAADERGIAVSCLASPVALHDARSQDALALRPIELTDLLGRPQAALDREAVSRLLRDRVVLVTGAGGSIGSELVRQVAGFAPERLVLLDHCEFNLYAIDRDLAETLEDGPAVVSCLCDIRHAERLDEIFAREKPHLVFNAAALKHVPMVEMNPCEGVLTNVAGTANVAEAARRHGALAMVQVSTDKAVDSTSVMGATKRIGELLCQALDLEAGPDGGTAATRFMTTRFGNVLGSSGSLIPHFRRQLERGGPLTVTDERMTRFFMTIREAVELTLQASAAGLGDDLGRGEIFVLDMGEPLRIVDVARRMIRLAGHDPERIGIEIIGARPGEKLFEELFDTHEERVDSPIPGVFGAIPQAVSLRHLRDVVRRLEERARVGDLAAVFALMREVVPRYRQSDVHVAASELPVPERSPERPPLPENVG